MRQNQYAYVHIDPDNYTEKINAERRFIARYGDTMPLEAERARARIAYYEKRQAEQEQKEKK